MSSHHGQFVWYELMTTDQPAAEAFYRKVVGWDLKDAGTPGMAYTLLQAGETQVGGLMTLPEEARAAGARPGWIGYIAVDGVDAYAAKVKQAGGTVHRAPDDIPGVGRFAMVADPHGAVFALFQGNAGDAPPAAGMGKPGHVGWHELMAGDGAAAFTFYSGLFGWTKDQAMETPMGPYQLFAVGGGQAIGAMMTKPADIPAPFWRFYFEVDGIKQAVERLTGAGGKVIHGPMQVPADRWVVTCVDPQGATFSLLGPQA